MTEPAPEPAAEPVPEAAHVGHFAHWFAEHVAPDVSDIRIKAENAAAKGDKALAYLKAHASNAAEMAALLAEVVKTAAPGDAASGRVAKAEAIAMEAARIATDVLAGGM